MGSEMCIRDSDGEWRVDVAEAGKRGGVVTPTRQTRPQGTPPDLWLLFAPVKKTQTDFIVEKATELGAARLCPIQTDFTNSDRIRRDRMEANAREAAEQCGITYIPKVDDLTKLDHRLADWPEGRKILFCDETRADVPSAWEKNPGERAEARGAEPQKAAILVGPEGGFSEREREALTSHPATETVSLGPRILRAETAAIAALTLWQAARGDWS